MLIERVNKMKCLVFSDSHGSPLYMKRALEKNKDAEVVFFLGDGLSDADMLARCDDRPRMWIAVRGNCDFSHIFLDREVNKTEEIAIEGKRIVLTHGDLYGAKYGTRGLCDLALSRGADIVLFGHTHTAYEEYVSEEGGFYLFNPGSIGSPNYTFGILTLSEGAVLFSHGSL